MPGLKQLNAFTNKLLSLGNETEIRLSNGEPRRQIPLPPNANDDDDSGDFIFGIGGTAAPPKDEDDDFLAGLGIGGDSSGSADDDFFANLDVDDPPSGSPSQTAKSNLPSVEDILSDPDAHAADDSSTDDFLADLGIPDLPPEQKNEPEQPSIEEESDPDPFAALDSSLESTDPFASVDIPTDTPDPFAALDSSLEEADPFAALDVPTDTSDPLEGLGPLGDISDEDTDLQDPFATPIEDVANESLIEGLETLGDIDSFATAVGNADDYPDLSDLEMPQEFNLSGDTSGNFEEPEPFDTTTESAEENDPFASIMEEAAIEEEAPRPEPPSIEEPIAEPLPPESEAQIDLDDALSMGDLGEMDLDLSNLMSSVESLLSDTPTETSPAATLQESTDETPTSDAINTPQNEDLGSVSDFDTDIDLGDLGLDSPNDESALTDFADTPDFSNIADVGEDTEIGGDFDTNDLALSDDFNTDTDFTTDSDFGDIPDLSNIPGLAEDFGESNDFEASDFSTDFETNDTFDSDTSFDTASAFDSDDDSFDSDFPSADSLPSLDDLPHTEDTFDTTTDTSTEALDDLGLGDDLDLGENFDTNLGSDIVGDIDLDAAIGGEIPDLDFPETDATLAGGLDFGDDEFALPTMPTPEETKKAAAEASKAAEFDSNFSVGDQPKKKEKKEVPSNPNEFTDDEYKRFLHILNTYPLNLRIAIEELIVENQFTDDVVSGLIRRIIKKGTPRQIASEIGKLTDKTISIPRDFEKRTAEQYELYKKSVEYQIKNRVLPAFFMTIAAGIAGYILFFVGMRFVYEPIHAQILYSQGYDLLELESYPQAEQKFNQGYEKRPMISWFFKYAAAYREQKQFERARQVYDFGLRAFNNDKKLALEYARMETLDLANYERSEEIIRRHILDFHINDSDGMLLLGDVYLEWATEKDPSKFEDARTQYATLIELYGSTNTYLSRMLRYFIRTDNLREVLPLNDYFFNQKEALSANDVIELGGYLLEKQYGYLSPTDEYLRTYIEDVYDLLNHALDVADTHPEAYYNMSKYFIYTNNRTAAKDYLNGTIIAFDMYEGNRTRKLISKNIDSHRLLGNLFSDEEEYLRAEELYTQGIDMYEREKDVSSLKQNEIYGKLYEDMGNINYFISGDLDMAYIDYTKAVNELNDTPKIRYKIGYIEYANENYLEALNTFIKTSTEAPDDKNLLLAMGNVLALRGDYFASQAYYDMLLTNLDTEREQMGILIPQVETEDGNFVNTYMWAANNSAVTLYRLAQQTGNSAMNAQAMVQFSESSRAYDALTRNPETLVRLEGTNLAAENLRYVLYPRPDFEPEIYTNVNRTLFGEETLIQSSIR